MLSPVEAWATVDGSAFARFRSDVVYEEAMPRTKGESVTRGSGNVFADLGLDRPGEVLAKARIVETIADLLARRNVSQQEAGKLVGLTQPQISRLMRGDTREFSYERLMRVLTTLGQDVEIIIRRTRDPRRLGRMLVR
jgi:predicted XRE-type DNA-binding protein